MVVKLYMIYDVDKQIQIGNARGGAYQNKKSAINKIHRLMKQDTGNVYLLQTFTLDRYVKWQGE